jgi:assimilatory nitrate reductase catalytic subunit
MFEPSADGAIKALWVMGTNPAVSLPARARCGARGARQARLLVCPENVASNTRTVLLTSWLPRRRWGGKDGTVTNSERRSLAPAPFLPLAVRRNPIGGSSRRWPSGWGTGTPSPIASPAEVFGEHDGLRV